MATEIQKLQDFVSALDSFVLTNKAEPFADSLYKDRYIKLKNPHEPSYCIEAFCTLRLHGHSVAPYDSFNLGLHVGDDAHAVALNRAQIKEDLGLKHLVFMDQTHSTDVLLVDDVLHQEPAQGFKCDAVVTTKANVGLAVMTADCLPVLLYVPGSTVVAAIHCGWRGLVNGIIENTIKVMTDVGVEPASIMMAMGPAIGPQSYEVGAEIFTAVIEQDSAYAKAFHARDLSETNGVQKYLFDLYQLAFMRYVKATNNSVLSFSKKLKKNEAVLGAEKVSKALSILADARDESKISLPKLDTLAQNDVFFSYRAAKVTGRMASIIVCHDTKDKVQKIKNQSLR